MTALPLWFHQALLNTFAMLSITANTLLIFLVFHSSSKNLGNYRVLLCTFAFVDITISLYHASVIPAFVQAEFGFVIFAFHTLYLPDKIGYAMNIFYCILFYEPFILLTFHFFYRVMSVTRAEAVQAHFWKGLFLCALLNCCFSFMITADVWLIYPEVSENFFADVLMREYGIDLFQEPPPNCIPVHYIHAPGYGTGLNWHSIISMLSCGSMINAMIIFNVICGHVIMKAVKHHETSSAFRQFQVQLLKALVVQFTIPVMFCVVPFALIVGLPATGINFGQAGNIMGFVVSAFPVIDPICVILAYSRFRGVITKFFRQVMAREVTVMVQSRQVSSVAIT